MQNVNNTDLVNRLWKSDTASALTNEAAREISRLTNEVNRKSVIITEMTEVIHSYKRLIDLYCAKQE